MSKANLEVNCCKHLFPKKGEQSVMNIMQYPELHFHSLACIKKGIAGNVVLLFARPKFFLRCFGTWPEMYHKSKRHFIFFCVHFSVIFSQMNHNIIVNNIDSQSLRWQDVAILFDVLQWIASDEMFDDRSEMTLDMTNRMSWKQSHTKA